MYPKAFCTLGALQPPFNPPVVPGLPMMAIRCTWASSARNCPLWPHCTSIKVAIAGYTLSFPENRGFTGHEPMIFHMWMMLWMVEAVPHELSMIIKVSFLWDGTKSGLLLVSPVGGWWGGVLSSSYSLAKCHSDGRSHPSSAILSFLTSPLVSFG